MPNKTNIRKKTVKKTKKSVKSSRFNPMFVIILAVVFAAVGVITLRPSMAARGGGTGGNYTVSVSPAGPYHFKQQVTITTNAPVTNSSFLALTCNQNGSVVYGDTHALFSYGYYYGLPFNLGPSLKWTSGAADCTATAFHQSHNKQINDAATSFHVDP